ncbi:Uncharacterised protein [Streptococcus pneumoniae]|nr:Uncharacterised protein [Streptococcus pneumoniae]
MSFQYVYVGMLVLIWGEQNPLLIEDRLAIRLAFFFFFLSTVVG